MSECAECERLRANGAEIAGRLAAAQQLLASCQARHETPAEDSLSAECAEALRASQRFRVQLMWHLGRHGGSSHQPG